MDRAQATALGMVLFAVVVGATLGRSAAEPDEALPPLASVVEAPASDPGAVEITVYVSGPVASPGVLRLPAGAIVADAIAAAGGALPQARLDAINLAQPLADGEQVAVPGPEAVPPQTGEGGPAGGKVAINRATPAELEGLPGVGPVLAERIVAYRETNGPFETVEDLLDVPGIGESKLDALRDLITVP